MKYLRVAILGLLMAVPSFVFSQNVKFEPAEPAAGSSVKFSYDPKGTKLEGKTDIVCNAYSFTATTPKSATVKLVKDGARYFAEVPSADSVTLLALAFSSGDVKDDKTNGYYVKLSNRGNIPAEAYVSEAYVLDFFGQYYIGIKSDPAKALSCYQKAFELKPSLKNNHIYAYLRVGMVVDPVAGAKRVDEHLSQLSALKSPSEKDMMVTASLFRLLKQNAKADSISKAIVEHFPIGEAAFAGQLAGLQKQTDPEILEQGLDELVRKFKLDLSQKASESKIASIYNALAISYGQQKNWKKVDFYAGKITDKVRLASVYNTIAWPLAELNQETQAASALSKKSLALIEAAKADEHPVYTTREQYLENLDRSYLMYADTYALLLHNQGNDKEAVKYQEMALDFSDNPGLERYVMYLDLSGSKDKAFSEAERIIKEGKGTEALKARFKTLYESKKLAEPFESYLSKIEQSLIEKEKKEWIGKMTNEPAPSFSLINRKGETVSLASLKGKVIVLDYWATWCGPCVASFPGMQKAVNKYAADPNVVFLFVNTWQREANREEVVNKFFAENKYEFNVLYDTRNKDNPEVFDVITAYKVKGIPTKFIIDKQGKIRFTVVGHSSEKDVVKEMDLLISLASSEQSK